jgi:hypothetical protein
MALRVDDGRQRVIVDPDQLQSLEGEARGAGGHSATGSPW